MSLLLEWFASPAWSRLVETLLHSLWQGTLLAGGLLLALRFVSRPNTRYRLALLALAGTVASSLVTWAVLQQAAIAPPAAMMPAGPAGKISAHPTPAGGPSLANVPAIAGGQHGNPGQSFPAPAANPLPEPAFHWSAWLAVLWLAGAAGMLFRAGGQVAGAGRVRRECRPLPAGPASVLLEEVQKTLGLARRIRVVVADRLASPAVAGVLVPVLILPLPLLTALSPEQLRFILLHELAHIRRGDYLVNLFQLLIEALLFFNPAVWWISRQLRLEREVCCDAVAIELSGAPVEYARTLLQVAERYAQPVPAAALAFGDRREPSGLAERIQRLLSPNDRPRLRLTWRAMLGTLITGGALLVLSALGTRLTVAAILTPQQRMDRIEKLLAAQGEEDFMPAADNGPLNQIDFSGRVRTEDGGQLPQRLWVHQFLQASHNSSCVTSVATKKDATFTGSCQRGQLTLSAQAPGYAPCVVGPIKMQGTNAVNGLELVFRRGFSATIQMVDLDSGAPLANAVVTARPADPNYNLEEQSLTTDSQGLAVMTNCASLPVALTGSAAGYEIVQQSFPCLMTNETLRLATRRGLPTTGRVLDKASGRPIAGATLQVLKQEGAVENQYDWNCQPLPFATSDDTGHFATTGLRQDSRYRLGVSAPGHESVVFRDVQAGDSNLVARLGPELIVHGRVTGNVQLVPGFRKRAFIDYSIIDSEDHNSWGYLAEGRLTNGVIYFEFTNRAAGPVALSVAGYRETRMVDAPVADWLVNLTNAPATPADTTPPKMREVVVRLKSSDGVPPQGAIELTVPSNPHNLKEGDINKKVVLTNGEARLEIPVGARITYQPDKTTLGYWFEGGFNWTNIVSGDGPMVIEAPAIPAGIITARARNADGSAAGGLSFSIKVLKPSAAVKNESVIYGGGDSFSGNDPRTWLSPPLPLGGKYEIIGWRGHALCASGPVKLTEAAPDPAVELQFAPGQDITGRILAPDGRPLRGVTVTGLAEVDGNSFDLNQPGSTDAQGEFRLTDCSPDVAQYTLEISQPGYAAERVKVNFKRLPLTVKLKPGIKLTGKVVEAATGYEIFNAEVRAFTEDSEWSQVTTHTDADGNYEFTTLGDATYNIYVGGASFGVNYANTFHAGVVTNLLLKVTPYQGSQLTVRRPN